MSSGPRLVERAFRCEHDKVHVTELVGLAARERPQQGGADEWRRDGSLRERADVPPLPQLAHLLAMTSASGRVLTTSAAVAHPRRAVCTARRLFASPRP